MPMHRRRRPRVSPASASRHPDQTLASQWILKILLDMNGLQEVITGRNAASGHIDILRTLGLEELIERRIEANEALDQLNKRQRELSHQHSRFDPLRSQQALALFQQNLADHGQEIDLAPQWQHRLAQLDNLTPGDFHAVLRARRLAPEPLTPENLLQGLESECKVKEEYRGRGIGFMAAIH